VARCRPRQPPPARPPNKTLETFIDALRWNPANADAWAELLDYASAAPDIPTLVEMFARAPLEVRTRLLRQLLTLSRGQDRLGSARRRASACEPNC